MSKTTSSKIRCKKLVDSVFGRNIYIVIGAAEDATPFLRKKFGYEDELDEGTDNAAFIDADNEYVIWMPLYDDSPECIGWLVHEVTHGVLEIFDYIGIKYHSASEEAFCYYEESLVRQIIKFARSK